MSWHDPNSSVLEAALGRGDRRLGAVIRRAWQKGARFRCLGRAFRLLDLAGGIRRVGARPGLVRAARHPDRRAVCRGRTWTPASRRRSCSATESGRWRPGPPPTATGARAPSAACLRRQGLPVTRGSGGRESCWSAPGDEERGWRYVGPPGDPRRFVPAATAGPSGDFARRGSCRRVAERVRARQTPRQFEDGR